MGKSKGSVKIKARRGGLMMMNKSGTEEEYHVHKSTESRRRVLRKLIRGGRSVLGPTNALKVFRKLNLLYLYRKNQYPAEAAIIKSDRDYVKNKYYGSSYWSGSI